MDEPSPQAFANGARHLAANPFNGFPHTPTPHGPSSFAPHHLDPNLQALDNGNTFAGHFPTQLGDGSGQQLPIGNPFTPNTLQDLRTAQINSPQQHVGSSGGQFGVLTPQPAALTTPSFAQTPAVARIQRENGQDQDATPDGTPKKESSHFPGMKNIPNPPDLARWRQKLFDVEETMTLTEEEFQTYFPHVDNIYSHRSTQKYKKKPFVSHYWDCRLKGRPPGTPKSDDPNKKKRKRNARERDLCDVKIKITEHNGQEQADGVGEGSSIFANGDAQANGGKGKKYYTIARVNGNNGNGKGDGVPGPHKHNLEESDRVKKSSIQRLFLKEEKERKKVQKSYHKRATGVALGTVKRHSKDHEIKLYGSCFCPFVQRIWIALELKDMGYQYIEVDPYKKPQSLLEVNPLGLVPALRHGDWCCHESTVLLEYLEDLDQTRPLLPGTDPRARAHSRLWADHVNRKIVPLFYRTLQAQDPNQQALHSLELQEEINKLVAHADLIGPFFLGNHMTFVDVQFAPWMLRLSRVLKPYRNWPDPEPGSRWARWVDAIEGDVDVRATTSSDELYLDSYERYAENRPNTSQVANAINAGRNLP